MALTDMAVRNAKPREKAYKLSDERGMYLEVTPSGGKLWRLKYRFEGKEKRLALGKYPEVGLAAARERRDDARRLLSSGIDPSEERKAKAEEKRIEMSGTFEAVAREWFEKMKPSWAPTHYKKVQARLENDLFPWLGSRPIKDLKAPEILSALKRVSGRGALDTAKRTQQDCGAVFRYAIQNGFAEYNPVPDLKGALPSPPTRHFAALVEPKDAGALLRAIDAFSGTLIVQTALRLAPLTFVRPGELRQAKWSDIDLEAREWRFSASKVKTGEEKRIHIVPLATQAVALLRDLQPLTGKGEYVFPGARAKDRPMSDAAVNAALRRMGYDTRTEITGHGFRAMARTILHEQLGIAPEIIEHQLAHRVPDLLGGAYNRTKFLDDRRAMMQRWADYLEKLKAGADVVPLPTAA